MLTHELQCTQSDPVLAEKSYQQHQREEAIPNFNRIKGNTNRRNYAENNRHCEKGSYFCPLPHFWECSKLASYSTKTKEKKEAQFLFSFAEATQFSFPNEKLRF